MPAILFAEFEAPASPFCTLANVEDSLDITFGFAKRRNTAVASNGVLPSVVASEHFGVILLHMQISVCPGHHPVQVRAYLGLWGT